MKKALLALMVVLLLAAAMSQWGLDRTPAGAHREETAAFPTASSLLDFFGGARQYLAFTFYIKADKLHHAYYGSLSQEAELVPYFMLIALLDRNYVSAYYVGAGIIDEQGRTREAIDFTQRGIMANPQSADLYYSLGDFYLKEKRYEEAKEAFQEALMYESEIVSRNTLLTALAATYGALGDEEARRRALMDKALYNKVELYGWGITYERAKKLVRNINGALNGVTGPGGERTPGEGGI